MVYKKDEDGKCLTYQGASWVTDERSIKIMRSVLRDRGQNAYYYPVEVIDANGNKTTVRFMGTL